MKFALLVSLSLVTALPTTPLVSQTRPRQPHRFLKTHIGLTDAEVRNVEQGQVITKNLETRVGNEVVVFGVVWINATTDAFVEHYRNIESFEEGDSILHTKKLSEPPRLEDLEDLTLPEEDLSAIPECKVGDCEVQLDETALLRLQEKVDWSAEDAHNQANKIARESMFEIIQTYLEGGDKALAAYRDRKRPTFLEMEFGNLLESSPYLVAHVPELHTFLAAFPNTELPGSESYLYWSMVELGLRPTLRLNHVVIYPLEKDYDASVAVASKTLYASHYIHIALDLTFVVKDSAKPNVRGFYLISLSRSRSDGLTDTFGGISRVTAERRLRSVLTKYLEMSKKRLEEG